MTVPVLAAYVVFLARQARSRQALFDGIWALGLGLGMTAFFWLPALAERDWVKTVNLFSGYLNYRNHFVFLHQLIHFGKNAIQKSHQIVWLCLCRQRCETDQIAKQNRRFGKAIYNIAFTLFQTLGNRLRKYIQQQ